MNESTPYVVCEIIHQEPSVSLHGSESAAVDWAARRAVRRFGRPPESDMHDLDMTDAKQTLTEFGRIQEGDYEIHVLKPKQL